MGGGRRERVIVCASEARRTHCIEIVWFIDCLNLTHTTHHTPHNHTQSHCDTHVIIVPDIGVIKTLSHASFCSMFVVYWANFFLSAHFKHTHRQTDC